MANSIFDRLRNWFIAPLLDSAAQERLTLAERQRDYRSGVQRRQLKVRPNQHDDNVVLNYTGLVIDRSVSMLFGKGVNFDLPGDDGTAEDEYIKAVWRANKKEITLQRLAILGAEQGTCYLKILPDGIIGMDDITTFNSAFLAICMTHMVIVPVYLLNSACFSSMSNDT